MQNDRVIRAASDEAVHITGLSNTQRWRLEAEGKFPKRFKLSPSGGRFGSAGYRLSDLQRWLAERSETVGAEVE